MYNKKLTYIRHILTLVGFQPCTRGDLQWIEYTNGAPQKPDDRKGGWRFQRYPFKPSEVDEYNEMSDEDKRSCCWQLAYWGYGSSPRWSDMEGGFNVDEIDIEYFMNYVRKVFTVEWQNVREYFINELIN